MKTQSSNTAVQYKMDSSVGPIYLVATEKGLRGVLWKKQTLPMVKSLEGNTPELKVLKKTIHQLEEFLEGKRKDFDLVYDIDGTDFQKKVWAGLAKIPYGKTCSYKDLAARIDRHKAMRAVGTANGRNPLSIIVPCHRVIAADGTLGGYAGGLEVKQQLLDLEKKHYGHRK